MPNPHILIVMHYMEIGGAETALVGLLHAIEPDRADVDLFLHDHRGEMMKFIPGWVNVLPPVPVYTMLERPLKELVKRGFWKLFIARLRAKLAGGKAYDRSRSGLQNAGIFHYVAKYTTPLLPEINPDVTYDLAISFVTPHQVTLDKVSARRKVAWIHTDYTRVWVNAEEELPVWERFDRIASISPDVTRTFLQVFPSLAPKIIEIENILSPEFVRRRAELFSVEDELSVYYEGGGDR